MTEDATTSAPALGRDSLTQGTAVLLAIASGQAVATAYYSQPLLATMAEAFAMERSAIGLVGTATQVGYAVGLALVAPLGDILPRPALIAGLLFLSAPALAAVALAPTGAILLSAMTATGALAVAAQIMVAYAAGRARAADRGKAVAIVTSGIIVGILLARAVSGAVADLFGWRAIYAASAVAAVLMALLLRQILPREHRPDLRISYPQLVLSLVTLFAEIPVLRVRAALACLIFFSITTLLTPLALVLSAEPFSLSQTAIGLFGLAGAAGAFGAAAAGRWSDDGRAERATALALAAMLAAWLPSALLFASVSGLVVGVIVMDFGLQAAHVANQSLIYRVRPDARSRLAAAYMLLYSAGCAAGSIASTLAFAHGGWAGVCLLGSVASTAALLFWATTRRFSDDR